MIAASRGVRKQTDKSEHWIPPWTWTDRFASQDNTFTLPLYRIPSTRPGLTMETKKNQKLCKFHSSGFCKFKDQCHYRHVHEVCLDRSCSRRGCFACIHGDVGTFWRKCANLEMTVRIHTRVFGKINFVTNQLGELTMAVDIVHKPPKKIWGHLEQNSGLASRFYFIKEIRKIYKGKCGPSAFFIFRNDCFDTVWILNRL